MRNGKFVSVICAVMLGGPALAAAPGDRIDQRFETRQASQQARIEAGVSGGSIGPREAGALGRQQAAIDRAYDRRIADGRLGYRDALALDRRLDRGASSIRAAKVRTRG